MNILYSWLADFISSLPAPSEIAHILSELGIEVSAVRRRSIPQGVVVGRIMSVTKHPNADRLQVCLVNAGKDRPLNIVCGAPNVAVDMNVAVALPETVLSGSLEVKKATIRGVVSEGMICSERELGISDDHSGIMALPSEYKTGTALSNYYPDDAVLEVEITPNRGDCLSVLGIARELGAKLKQPIRRIVKCPQESERAIDNHLSVFVEATQGCPRYAGRLIRNVTVRPSPPWLRHRLTAVGMRPINNIVDVTNYIMLHFGHPMHAFDYDRLAGKTIRVKKAEEGQTFVTLDGAQHQLTADDLLICDDEKAVALAGIMGGHNSGITNDTTNVFLECAYFDPICIRMTSKRLGVSTDSSYRFERGVDPGDGLLDSIDTAAELIAEVSGGTVCRGRIDVVSTPLPNRSIALRSARISRVLGVSISDDEAVVLLSSLGITPTLREEGRTVFAIPSFRHDLLQEVDLIEEIGRLYGYNVIPPAQHATVSLYRAPSLQERKLDLLRTLLAGRGLHEICTNSMTSPSYTLPFTPNRKPVIIANPLTPNMSHMRTTLLPSMLEVIAYNLNRNNCDRGYFELGFSYEDTAGSDLPSERQMLAIALEGNVFSAAWNSSPVSATFYVLKGIVETLLTTAGIGNLQYEDIGGDHPFFDSDRAMLRNHSGIEGTMGRISPRVLRMFDIHSTVFFAELDITSHLNSQAVWPVYHPVPRFPPLRRDFCFVMPKNMQSGSVEREIASVSPLIESVQAFDVYFGESLGRGNKSITYSLTLRSPEKTLTDAEADAISTAIVTKMKEKFGIELRK